MVRNISPMTVYFDNCLSLAMFGDIRRIARAETCDKLYSHMPVPYTSDHFNCLHWMDKDSHGRDYWSVGVVLLEILVGTKLVVNCRSFAEVKDLYTGIRDFIDEKTQHLLCWLLWGEP